MVHVAGVIHTFHGWIHLWLVETVPTPVAACERVPEPRHHKHQHYHQTTSLSIYCTHKVSVSPRRLLAREVYTPVQSRFAETRFAKTCFAETPTLTLNPNFGETGFGESGRHQPLTLILANRVSVKREDTLYSEVSQPTHSFILSWHAQVGVCSV